MIYTQSSRQEKPNLVEWFPSFIVSYSQDFDSNLETCYFCRYNVKFIFVIFTYIERFSQVHRTFIIQESIFKMKTCIVIIGLPI